MCFPRQVVLISQDVICYYGRNSIWLAWKSIQHRETSQQSAATSTYTDICKAGPFIIMSLQPKEKVTPNVTLNLMQCRCIVLDCIVHRFKKHIVSGNCYSLNMYVYTIHSIESLCFRVILIICEVSLDHQNVDNKVINCHTGLESNTTLKWVTNWYLCNHEYPIFQRSEKNNKKWKSFAVFLSTLALTFSTPVSITSKYTLPLDVSLTRSAKPPERTSQPNTLLFISPMKSNSCGSLQAWPFFVRVWNTLFQGWIAQDFTAVMPIQ